MAWQINLGSNVVYDRDMDNANGHLENKTVWLFVEICFETLCQSHAAEILGY